MLDYSSTTLFYLQLNKHRFFILVNLFFSFLGILFAFLQKLISMDSFQSLWNEEFDELKITPNKKKRRLCTISSFTVEETNRKSFSRGNGDYYSIGFKRDSLGSKSLERELTTLSAEILSTLIRKTKVLVVGLGNQRITADSLGSEVIDELSNNRKKLLLCKPSVFGLTGIESYTMVKALAQELLPSSIICLDSLTCISENNLYSSIQISNAGLVPGSGVGNHRPTINKETIGVPIISMGVPLISRSNPLSPFCVTPKEIDVITKMFASIIGKILLKATNNE